MYACTHVRTYVCTYVCVKRELKNILADEKILKKNCLIVHTEYSVHVY